MSDEYEVRKGDWELDAGISVLFRKAPCGPPGLTSPSHGRIAINSTYEFRRDLGYLEP